MLWSVSDGEEVDDPGGEVQSHVCFTVDHSDAVSVPVAGPGHPTTEQQERRPTHTHTHVTIGHVKLNIRTVWTLESLSLVNKVNSPCFCR